MIFLKENYYETLFYRIIQIETKSVRLDLIVTFCFISLLRIIDYLKLIDDKYINSQIFDTLRNMIMLEQKN